MTADLDAHRLSDLKELRARFAPDLASLPQVSVELTPLKLFEAAALVHRSGSMKDSIDMTRLTLLVSALRHPAINS